MHIISMLLLPQLFLLSAVLGGVSAVESVPTFAHLDPGTRETLVCDQCPPGTHMTAYCTAATPTACAPCRPNQFTELWNYLPRCIYCYDFCTENQEVETECSATTNRVCRCKLGFYRNHNLCMRHSECGPGFGVQTNGTSTLNTVCEKCEDGFFSASSSALESCVKHQECPSGQIKLLPGSNNQDSMCGTCEDLSNGGETLRTFVSGFFNMHRMRVAKMKTFVARYINNGTTPKHRGPLTDQIRTWLAQAPEEQLKKLPQMLKDSQLCTMTEKLEKILADIKQQTPTCSSPFLGVQM